MWVLTGTDMGGYVEHPLQEGRTAVRIQEVRTAGCAPLRKGRTAVRPYGWEFICNFLN